MQFLRAVVNGLVAVFLLLFGLLAGAVVALGALAIFLGSRLRLRAVRPKPRAGHVERGRSRRDGDAIEVSATEVSSK